MSRLALMILLFASTTPSHASFLKSKASMADLLVAARHRQNPITVPEHGFDGRMIKHETMMSATEDWAEEYGPKEPKKPRHAESYGSRSEVSVVVALATMMVAARV
eukprot:gnl/TRDRNA2_/TRDRNA2_181181_c0_seq1.p1 gnl/TRDRNA2_/TRDRNA2_181181_c0~~gnl/TRDRNA2_/TRDRNA2_181181_c0_seq1.p1  ORF type:complete len:106 (-),score=20.00 gnl/TRDRNA2_/TRDRNA2_181181_c0_seq1:60-377(-)